MLIADIGAVGAQEGDMFVRVTPDEGRCPTDAHVIGYIGYKDLECNCAFSVGPNGPMHYEFRAEPVIGDVEVGSPADGKLRAGDVITAVDGHLITTREGGRLFARMTPGTPVTLSVRRRGREIDVTVTPNNACFEVFSGPPPRAPAPTVAPLAAPAPPTSSTTTPAPPRRPTVATPTPSRPATLPPPPPPPPPPPNLSSGWLGFSIRCNDCSTSEREGEAEWTFNSPPEVQRVEGRSPASRVGIQAGDILTHINGNSLTSVEGGVLFGAVEPGDTVTFRYRRNNSNHETQVVAEMRPGYRTRLSDQESPDSPPRPTPEVTRFSGVIGDAHVLVTGGPVSVNRTDGEVVIQAGNITVRVRRTGGDDEGVNY